MRHSCRYPLLKRRSPIHKAIPRNDYLGPTAMLSDLAVAQEFKTLRDTFRMFDVVNQKGVVNLESFLSVVCASEDDGFAAETYLEQTVLAMFMPLHYPRGSRCGCGCGGCC